MLKGFQEYKEKDKIMKLSCWRGFSGQKNRDKRNNFGFISEVGKASAKV
jgi:hypothetical protein